MLSILGRSTGLCDGIPRREALRVGALAFGGLTLADVLRARAGASAAGASSAKSVIMVWLRGGPSHIDETDSHGGRHKGTSYTPGNIMANLYHHLGLDPAPITAAAPSCCSTNGSRFANCNTD